MKSKSSKTGVTKVAVGMQREAGDAVPNVRVLKTAQCKSLSGRSNLGYEIGTTKDNEIHLRIKSNSGHGCFGKDWVSLRTLQQALAKATGPITSGTLRRVFSGKSANTSGFVTAAALNEGLLEPLANSRGYAPTDGVGFMSEVRRLLEGGAAQVSARAPAKKSEATIAPTKKAEASPKAKAAKAAKK